MLAEQRRCRLVTDFAGGEPDRVGHGRQPFAVRVPQGPDEAALRRIGAGKHFPDVVYRTLVLLIVPATTSSD